MVYIFDMYSRRTKCFVKRTRCVLKIDRCVFGNFWSTTLVKFNHVNFTTFCLQCANEVWLNRSQEVSSCDMHFVASVSVWKERALKPLWDL